MEIRKPIWMIKRASQCALLVLVFSLLSGCVSTRTPSDPLEPFNRTVYHLNRGLDKVLFRPLAIIYNTILPNFAQRSVNNFFYNFYEPSRVINDFLRADFKHAAHDSGRLIINTIVGIGGLFDVASEVGLPRHRSDFGMTLAKWGYQNSTFIMVPIFGPTTIRDGVGYLFNLYAFTLWPHIQPPSLAWTLYGVDLVHHRAALLSTDDLIKEAMDPYAFIRDAFIQKRHSELAQIIEGYGDYDDTFVDAEEYLDEDLESNL